MLPNHRVCRVFALGVDCKCRSTKMLMPYIYIILLCGINVEAFCIMIKILICVTQDGAVRNTRPRSAFLCGAVGLDRCREQWRGVMSAYICQIAIQYSPVTTSWCYFRTFQLYLPCIVTGKLVVAKPFPIMSTFQTFMNDKFASQLSRMYQRWYSTGWWWDELWGKSRILLPVLLGDCMRWWLGCSRCSCCLLPAGILQWR